jgi:hypothetical protein
MNGNKAPNSIDADGGADYDKSMEARISRLERQSDRTLELLGELATEVAIIKATYARQEDLKALEARLLRAMGEQSWRLVTFVCGFGTALVAATYFVAKNIH